MAVLPNVSATKVCKCTMIWDNIKYSSSIFSCSTLSRFNLKISHQFEVGHYFGDLQFSKALMIKVSWIRAKSLTCWAFIVCSKVWVYECCVSDVCKDNGGFPNER